MRATIERPGLGETARVRARIAALSSRGPAGGGRGRIGPKPPFKMELGRLAAFTRPDVRSVRSNYEQSVAVTRTKWTLMRIVLRRSPTAGAGPRHSPPHALSPRFPLGAHNFMSNIW